MSARTTTSDSGDSLPPQPDPRLTDETLDAMLKRYRHAAAGGTRQMTERLDLPVTTPRPRWWQTRRWSAERYARTCEDALTELLKFVSEELDCDPHPWAAYFSDSRHAALAGALQEQRYPNHDA